MDIFTAATRIPKALNAAKDLITKIGTLHDDPAFKALMASDPSVKKLSDDISKDARTIQDCFK